MVGKLPRWIGTSLRGLRAGLEKTLLQHPAFALIPNSIVLDSHAFASNGAIPRQYTDDGDKLSPPLSWRNIPSSAVTIVLVTEDADSPTPTPFVHLIAWGLSARDGGIESGALNSNRHAASSASLGRNGLYRYGYTPPDPPPGHGLHRYVFQCYAISTHLAFKSPPDRRRLFAAMQGHVVAKGALTGTYERS